MAHFLHANKVKEHIKNTVLNKKGVTGIGVGYADPDNPQKGAAIIIYTETASVATSLALPNIYSVNVKGAVYSAPTRVISMGKVTPNAKAAQLLWRQRIRPVPGAVSVGEPGGTGTGGLIGINFPARTQLLVMSNNHVLNPTNTTAFAPTLQSGPADGGTLANSCIGRLERFVRLTRGVNFLDAATAIPFTNSLLDPSYMTVGALNGHLLSYPIGSIFYKVGRTTGPRTGRVESVNATVNVDYSSIYPQLGVIRFERQTVILGVNNQAVSLPGDSGSVWIDRNRRLAAACNFAGNATGVRSICFPIALFMRVFGMRVAAPASTAGKVIAPKKRTDAWVRPLSKKELASIQVVKVKRRK